MKKVKYDIPLKLFAKNARPAPPISITLGPTGVDIYKFCAYFNNWSKDLQGEIKVGVLVYDDLSYEILTEQEYKKWKKEQFSIEMSALANTAKMLQNAHDKSTIEIIKLNSIETLKTYLEKVYALYTSNDGEMILIEGLECYIYKGKQFHHDQNLIFYNSSEGTIKIDGASGESIFNKSSIQLAEKEEISLAMISENSEEFQFLNKVIEKLCTIPELSSKTKK